MKDIRTRYWATIENEKPLQEKMHEGTKRKSQRHQHISVPMIFNCKDYSLNSSDQNGNIREKFFSEKGNLFQSEPWTEDYMSGDEESLLGVDNYSFQDEIKISREWCKGNDIEHISNMLGIPIPVVSKVYYKSSNVAENFIRDNIVEWQIGGPGIVVIIDTYPEGCSNTHQVRMSRPILCISEVKSMPQKYWVEALDSYDPQDHEQIETIKRHILHIVHSLVHPRSILITPHKSTLCSRADFDCLKSVYPTIVSTIVLARHNNDEQDVFSNLATIWKSVLDVCEEAQLYNSAYMQQFLVGHMWRKRYGDRAFEIFLYQLSLMQ